MSPLVADLVALGWYPKEAQLVGLELAPSALTATGNASQANAYALDKNVSTFGTVTSTTNSVKLPKAAAVANGYYIIRNTDAVDAINLYPFLADTINALGANVAISVPGGAAAIATKISSAGWFVELSSVTPPSWITYTPTVTPGGTMTYTGTTITGRYLVDYARRWCQIEVSADGTTGGTANSQFTVSLPVTATTAGTPVGVAVIDPTYAGFGVAGAGILTDVTTLRVQHYNAQAYGLGAARGFVVSGGYRI